jgi:hypothetical protein
MRHYSSCLRVASIFALLLVSVAFSPPAAATQPPESQLDCGGRPATKYAVVLDASSSLRRHRARRDSTYRAYARILSMVSGALCRDDQLTVYTFARGPESQMVPLDTITADARSEEKIYKIASIEAENYTRHTDFLVAIQRIYGDLVREDGVNVVFLVTDGSFFPLDQEQAWTVDALRSRLTDLGRYVQNIRDSLQLQVIGVGSDNVEAVDRDLKGISWPHAGDRQWVWRNEELELDLKDARGHALLKAIFDSTSYRKYSDFSVWTALIEYEEGAWQKNLGYTWGWGLGLNDFHDVPMRHLVFLPPGSSGSRVCPTPGTGGAVRLPQALPLDTGGRVFCSLSNPTVHELNALFQSGIRNFVFLPAQPSRSNTAVLRGLHDVVSVSQGQSCDSLVMSRHFTQGGRWPAEGEAIGSLRIINRGDRHADTTVDLHRYMDTHCRVPAFSRESWQRKPGQYVLLFTEPGAGTVQSRAFADPETWITTTVLRPGGFPFPPDKIGLLRVCVETLNEVPSGMKLLIVLPGKSHKLTPERGRARCSLQRGRSDNRHLYGFSSIVRLPRPDLYSARLVLVSDDANPVQIGGAPWFPVEFVQNGKLFLSWWFLIGAVVFGAVIQILVLVYFDKGRDPSARPWHKRGSAGTSIILSAVLMVLIAEAWILAREVDMEAAISPLFLASLVLYLIKMAAAALVPEYVEESAWGDIP